MEPRVAKRDRRLLLSYEVHHRVHCSVIYPILAPNGSSVIIYGHEGGMRILWRGGMKSRERKYSRGRSNGVKSHDVMVIDDEDEDPYVQEVAEGGEEEWDADELDPDCPYPSVSIAVDVQLEAGVLHIAVPQLDAASSHSQGGLLQSHAVLAIALADRSQRLVTVPLAAPTQNATADFVDAVRETQIHLSTGRSICRAIAIRLIAPVSGSGEDAGSLLIAGASDSLTISRVTWTRQSFGLKESTLESQTLHLLGLVTHLCFTPSAKSTQLLVVERSGTVRLFDPLPSTMRSDLARPSSSDSALDFTAGRSHAGRWLMAYQTSFLQDKLGRARRKYILDARWLLGGKAIIVLLEDGEWGIWGVAGMSRTNTNTEDFSMHGVLGSSSTSESTEPSKAQRIVSKLAPMTPNTRKAKAETLFVGAPRIPGVPMQGGISILQHSARIGQSDDSVIIWYGGEIYSITSVQAFWQRSTSGSGRGSGSLYSSSLTHVSDVNFMNEAITSISQFGSNNSKNNLGQMNTQRDILVSAEHHIIIVQNSKPSVTARPLSDQLTADLPTLRDQRMLDAGDLDIGGMDRLLDDMANDEARPRKVGFAH